MILCWVTSVAVPGPMQPTGHELDMEACRRTRYRHKPTQAQEYKESYTNYVGWLSSIEENSLDGTDDEKKDGEVRITFLWPQSERKGKCLT